MKPPKTLADLAIAALASDVRYALFEAVCAQRLPPSEQYLPLDTGAERRASRDLDGVVPRRARSIDSHARTAVPKKIAGGPYGHAPCFYISPTQAIGTNTMLHRVQAFGSRLDAPMLWVAPPLGRRP